MKFSEQWLREWVNPPISTAQLVEQFTMAGLEVDAVEAVAPAFDGVLIGEIIAAEPHPDADRLQVCQVDTGADEPLTIVCGAANARVGLKAPVATVGGKLPGGKIKKAKLRGVASFGMLSSASELGLAEQSDGLMELPADAPVGEDIRKWLQLDDVSIDIDLTPNRGDCLSIAGIARELGVISECPVEVPDIPAVEPRIEDRLNVTLTAGAECRHYAGRIVRGIDARAPTPVWMQERLRRSGLRSISVVVDITNYVLLELGQPMHAFDLARLKGGIEVRKANAGETLELLDGQTVTLNPDVLVIADDARAIAMAGIMGGAATAVDDSSSDIFLESAFFEPTAIAGHARNFGLHTDSSHRFERGVDPALQVRAIERATALLLELAGGQPGPVIEQGYQGAPAPRAAIRLRAARVERLLGLHIDADVITGMLQRLGLAVSVQGGEWQVVPPDFRFDLALEADLIEEIARIQGYDFFRGASTRVGPRIKASAEHKHGKDRLRQILVERGYFEAITYSFIDPVLQKQLDPQESAIALANPIASDLSVMRTNLWPGLITALLHNQNRQQERVRLFEMGLRFRRRGDETLQQPMLAGVLCGPVLPGHWDRPAGDADFYDLKGDVEALLAPCAGAGDWQFAAAEHPALHPGQTAVVTLNGEPVGHIGALHPGLAHDLGVRGQCFLFELLLQPLLAGTVPVFKTLSRFPSVRRDLAIIIDRGVPAGDVMAEVRTAAPDTLVNLQLFDVYEGEGIDPEKKNLALTLTFQGSSSTLIDTQVEEAVGAVLTALQNKFQATLRE